MRTEPEFSYGVCRLGAAAILSAPGDRGELVTQLLFGETVEVLDQRGKNWQKVRASWDNTIGWLRYGQLLPIGADDFLNYRRDIAHTADLLQPVFGPDRALPVPLGASLPGYDGIRFLMGNEFYRFSGQVVQPEQFKPSVAFLLSLINRYHYAPELAGGRTPLGIDAGGLIQNVFRLMNLRTYRQPVRQVRQGKLVEFIQDALPGDLAFFENKRGQVVHAGILLPDQKIAHVHGFVRIDPVDHQGIFDEAEGRYTHQLRLIRRLVALEPLPPEIELERKSSPKQIRLF